MSFDIKAIAYLSIIYLLAYNLFIKKSICSSYNYCNKYFFIWLLTTVISFLSTNFFIFSTLLFLILFYYKQQHNEVLLYTLLLYCVPPFYIYLPGIGPINSLFPINYTRLLIIFLLIPYLIKHRSETYTKTPIDTLIWVYIFYQSILFFRDNTFTNSLREIFLLNIDILIPYIAFRKHVRNINQIKHIYIALLLSVLLLATSGILESIKDWHFYQGVRNNLFNERSSYGYRAGSLRTVASFFGPIMFGYVLMVGIGIYLYFFQTNKNNNIYNYIALIILIFCLFYTLSRGPWVGTFSVIIIYLLFGPNASSRVTKSIVTLAFATLILTFTPFFQRFIDLLPFVGTIDSSTITYRQMLLDKSWIVFNKNPLFGSTTFLDTPEMESVRQIQGQGFVDMVNTYAQIALQFGAVGLIIFFTIFSYSMLLLFKIIKNNKIKKDQIYWISLSLFSIIVGTLITIATVSNIGNIPTTYWIIIALSSCVVEYYQNKLSSRTL